MPNPAIAIALVADRLIGDPQRFHPVAIFGTYATWWEKRLYRDSKLAGVAYLGVCVLPWTVGAAIVARRAPHLTLAASLWAALGGTTLEKTALKLAEELERGNIEGARGWVPWLCSRDPEALDEADIARAAVESVAENTSDAAIAPLVWASIGGATGVVLHRCVNTLDAMVGYKNERYRNFGWASARLDDLLAYVPARITAGAHVLLAGRRAPQAIRAWTHDAASHPSPNAGPVEATAAGALGVQLGGPTQYPHGVENRPRLGQGPAPTIDTIKNAVHLAASTQLLVGVLASLSQKRSSSRRAHR